MLLENISPTCWDNPHEAGVEQACSRKGDKAENERAVSYLPIRTLLNELLSLPVFLLFTHVFRLSTASRDCGSGTGEDAKERDD